MWTDWKGNVKEKAAGGKRGIQRTGGGENTSPMLTPLEERVAALLGVHAISGDPLVQESEVRKHGTYTS